MLFFSGQVHEYFHVISKKLRSSESMHHRKNDRDSRFSRNRTKIQQLSVFYAETFIMVTILAAHRFLVNFKNHSVSVLTEPAICM